MSKVQLDHEQLRSFDSAGNVISTNAAEAWPIVSDASIEGPGITVLLVRDDISTELVISEAQLVELGYIPALAPLEEPDVAAIEVVPCDLCGFIHSL